MLGSKRVELVLSYTCDVRSESRIANVKIGIYSVTVRFQWLITMVLETSSSVSTLVYHCLLASHPVLYRWPNSLVGDLSETLVIKLHPQMVWKDTMFIYRKVKHLDQDQNNSTSSQTCLNNMGCRWKTLTLSSKR